MSEYFPEPKFFEWKAQVDLDLSNYATKSDLEGVAGVDVSNFVKKVI